MEKADNEKHRETCKQWTFKVEHVPHVFSAALCLHCQVELEEEAESQRVAVGFHSPGHTRG